MVTIQISALRSCAKLLSSATSSDSSDQLKPRAAADSDPSVPLSRLDKSMYYGGSRAVFGKSLLRFVSVSWLLVMCFFVHFLVAVSICTGNKCFSKKHIPPYSPCWHSKLGHPWGCPPKIEDLSDIWPNRHAKFHADQQSPGWEICNRTERKKKSHSKVSIPPYTTYGGIKTVCVLLCLIWFVGLLIRQNGNSALHCGCCFTKSLWKPVTDSS